MLHLAVNRPVGGVDQAPGTMRGCTGGTPRRVPACIQVPCAERWRPHTESSLFSVAEHAEPAHGTAQGAGAVEAAGVKDHVDVQVT
jgi:hypothetical protein